MYIAAMRTAIQTELGDDGTVYTSAICDRAITHAVADLSRLLPLNKMHDTTVSLTVTNEAWTSDHDVAVTLNNHPIKYESETVTNNAGTTTYTRDTDYTMDYMNGTVTALSTGSIADSTAHKISYTKHPRMIDVSGITDMMRIKKLVYMDEATDDIWQDIPFKLWENFIILKKSGDLVANEHVYLYYETIHTIPAAAANGSYPEPWDEMVIVGAKGYACMVRAHDMIDAAATALTAAGTALGNIATRCDSSTGAAATEWADIEDCIEGDGANIVGSDALLQTGDDKIDATNQGGYQKEVADMYREYALAQIEGGRLRLEYVQAVMNELDAFVGESLQRNTLAENYLSAAHLLIREGQQYLMEFDALLRDAVNTRRADYDEAEERSVSLVN